MSLVQSNRAVDQIRIEDERDADGTKTGKTVAKVGTASVQVLPFSNDTVLIQIGDLRTLGKELIRIGWQQHMLHTKSSLESCLRELAS